MQLFESVSRWFSDMPVVRRARNGARVGVNEQVLLRVTGDEAVSTALLLNLSIGGACVRCDLHLPRGTILQIRANADTESEFGFTASVVDARPSELGHFTDYGLRLVELSVVSARAMQDFIKHRLKNQQAAHRNALPR